MKRNVAVAVVIAVLAAAVSLVSHATVSAQGPAGGPTTIPGPSIGEDAPLFTLTDTAGTEHSLADYLADGKIVVLEWFNPDCPYVKKYHTGQTGNESMHQASAFAAVNDVVWLAINSNRPGSQGSGLDRNITAREDYGIDYPILLDPAGTVGMSYGATSTPQIFIISSDRKVRYEGGADDTKLNTDTPGVNYVLNALTQVVNGEAVTQALTAHPGCSVKYPK